MHRHPRAESVGIAARPRLCGPRATLESATLPALPRAGSRDLRARRVSTADLEKGEELQVALGSCSEHKEGIMVLLVKGGERLIMRPCNLAHSSRAFEDFCRGQRRKTTRIRRPAWSCSSRSRPIALHRAAGALHPNTQVAPNSDSRRGCWVQSLFLFLFFVLEFLNAWVDWQL